ncbi:IS982 family transposase [Trichocoleus sp. DQ-A3]|nr:IS982 family transposase [Coleofasciculus sp. FACHB-125]
MKLISPMTSIDFPNLMIVVFVLVDDWYQRQIAPLQMAHPGVRPRFSDSEMLTLALLMDYLPFPGETQFLGFIRANYASWFPHLLDQSQFNRRLRQLDGMLEQLRRSWVVELGGVGETHLLIDTKPLPVLGLKRDKTRSDFSGNAAPGYCAARQMYYFGYKLTLLTTWNGIPIAYDLVPANTDERVAVESLFDSIRGCTIYGDKGFIDADWQHQLYQHTGNQVWTLQRQNQKQQHPTCLNRFICRVRQRIEGVFHEIQNTGRNPERLLNKTIAGFCVHIAAKLASHTLRLLLKRRFAIDVLTFRQAGACSS